MYAKKDLLKDLVDLEKLENKKYTLEQYNTPPEIVCEVLWDAKDQITGGRIADFGCGSGIFGVGCFLLGAREVFFVDIDKDAIETARRNCKKKGFKGDFRCMNIGDFDETVDVVFENPPFGTKKFHLDKIFLEKALLRAKRMVYSMHTEASERFVYSVARDYGFKMVNKMCFNFPIKAEHTMHKRDTYEVKVCMFRLEKVLK